MKQKLLLVLLIVLLITNSILLFILIKKPHESKQPPKRDFLIAMLHFDENQKLKYEDLDKNHHRRMRQIQDEIRKNKDILFNSFNDESFQVEEITNQIGNLEAKKDTELFEFFSKVRVLCNKNQKKEFDKIIDKALRAGNHNRGERKGNRPPPPKGDWPPPR